MNKVATQRQSRPLLTDLSVLLDTVPAFAALRPLFDTRTIRVEDEMFEDVYEIRAELPGVDREQDIEGDDLDDDDDEAEDDVAEGDPAEDSSDQLVSADQG